MSTHPDGNTSTTADDSFESLLKKQEGLEAAALHQGVERFRREVQKANARGEASTVGAAKDLLKKALEPTKAAIEAWLASRNRGPQHVGKRWILQVGPDVAAYLALKAFFDGITQSLQIRSVAINIADFILDELRFRRFQKEQPHLFMYRVSTFNTQNYAHRARTLDVTIAKSKISMTDLEMPLKAKIHTGVKLIDLVITATGLFDTSIVKKMADVGKQVRFTTEARIVATPKTLEWMSSRNEILEVLRPVNLPMVCPPLPWSPGVRGGYRFALRNKHKLVRGIAGKAKKANKQTEMPAVYAALNRIQETPWKVNTKVLELVCQIYEAGGGRAGIPLKEAMPLPPKPLDIDTNEVARAEWRKAASEIHEDNHVRKVKALEFLRVVSTAERFKSEQAIWFPCNLDFRGRIYPVVSYLSPQGDDVCRGLLTFAQGKPLGQDGAAYLAMHGANCLGSTPDGVKLSKCTPQERVDWIVSKSADIEAVANDPIANTWWMQADDPLQFVAFCFEWAGFVQAEREGRGAEYVSSLPCQADGSCNGLQHFSALLRDPIGASAVNVTPAERPQDIYQAVAEAVEKYLEVDAAGDSKDAELARLWITSGLVNRKLAKRPTMTFGYGSKQFGFKTQLADYLETHEEWHRIKKHFTVLNAEGQPTRNLSRYACAYMARLMWQALGDVVVKANEGMAWMQKVARRVSKGGKLMSWTVPGTNFQVIQEYFQRKGEEKVKTVLNGSHYVPLVFLDSSKPDPVKQANSIAPNVVHSLDAAALMMTVNAAADSGIDCFMMIHGSYGTLAADCPVLAALTRQSFFALYAQHDVVGSLHTQWMDLSPDLEDWPMPPESGSLDISGVLGSDYFFS